jgi:hypothetical protein
MVNFRKLSDRAKDIVDKRGGTDSLKQDAEELRKIARGEGSLKDKAKRAGEAIKDPGARGTEKRPSGASRPRYGRAEPQPKAPRRRPEADPPSTRSK